MLTTEKAQELFTQMVDLNYEVSKLRLELLDKSEDLEKVKTLLIEEIGDYNYDKLMYTGRKLFASAND